MRLFRKDRESLKIKRARGIRAIYEGETGVANSEEIVVQLITEDGERLELRIPPKVAPGLIWSMKEAYEAINPPINWRHNYQAEWGGGQ